MRPRGSASTGKERWRCAKAIVAAACLVLLMGGAAYAQDTQPKDAQPGDAQPKEAQPKEAQHKVDQHKADHPDTEEYVACEAKLSAAEKRVNDKIKAKLLSEGDADQVNKLLDEADAACTDGKDPDARKTLADVDKLVAGAAQPSQPSE